MKNLTIDYFEILGILKLIGGTATEKDKCLMNEEITLGVKFRLQRIIKALKDPFDSYEKERMQILSKYKSGEEPLVGQAYNDFMKEFEVIAKEKVTIQIDTISFEKIEGVVSSIDYTPLIEYIC